MSQIYGLCSRPVMSLLTEHIYYAHSAENRPYSDWQTMQSHAHNVGELAAEFAACFGAQEIARATGQLHDVGK